MAYSEAVLGELGPVVAAGLQGFPGFVRDDLAELRRVENRATAERLIKTADFAGFQMWCLRGLGVDQRLVRDIAIADIAKALTCSEIVAGTYLTVGEMLADRAPKIRAAFLAGDLDYQRVGALARVLGGVGESVIAAIEDELVAAARKLTPGPLQSEAERILISYDPDLASVRAQDARSRRRTRRRNAPFGMAWFEAFLTADEAIALEAMVDEVASTVCRKDVRTAGQRRADAFLALTRGEPAIACRCGRDDCPHAMATTHRPRNTPHVYVHVDLATLMQLANSPAVLAGYGPICPDYARLLAEDATWQLLIDEGLRLAEHWRNLTPDGEDGEDEDHEGEDHAGDSEGESHTADVPDPAAGGGVEPMPSREPADSAAATDSAESTESDVAPELIEDPAFEDYLERQHAAFLAEQELQEQRRAIVRGTSLPANARMLLGRSRPAPPIPLAAWYRREKVRFTPTGPLVGDGTIIDRILRRLSERPEDAAGSHPDGHGGFPDPPDGALTYRPTKAQQALVRARDGHCRFPGCARPAKSCEIDHIVPFDHADPRAGGWTIDSNMHCLCKHHHQLKTARAWQVVALAGAAEVWTSITGLTQISLPAGFRTCVVPPEIHLDRTPPPPVERPPHLRTETPPPENPDADVGDTEPPPF